ncbi:vimentin-type intermediate filament-associated coiled-coil protein-like isoform X2 [Centroberyx affinis]|uniref:vimentin-type intermediate filament-associated coiled-coil protein-like isoform X2 n=1 Tax=Centroberyx affinis TaxID=166261 RepID=UPI003A5BCEBA
MSSPSPVQIREANAHLAALHLRVLELEERLQAAENTVREQAESLIRKDDQMRAATQEITETKDREISFLNEKLCQCEETIKHYQQSIKERETLVVQLQHRCHLLDSICKSRATLDGMLALMAEAERLGPLGGIGEPGMANSPLTDLESSCSPNRAGPATDYCSPNRVICNHKDFSLSEDDVDSQDMDDMGFGTTV